MELLTEHLPVHSRLTASARRSRRSLRLLGDEQLADLIAAGESEALEVACNRHLPALVRYCQGILLVREDAEDAAQNAMLAAVRTLPGRPPRVKLRAWLFRVAHNEAISMLRRRRPSEPLEQAADAHSPDVTEAAATRARVDQLVKDLDALSVRQRSALLMRELCGLAYDEIGRALGSNEQGAMQTVFEARTSLLQFEQGRSLSCSGVQRMISDGDRRSLRARRVRAHIRSCNACHRFELAISNRRREFAVLLPVAGIGGGLAGILRVGGSVRHALAFRSMNMPSGVRGAAVTALLAAGGGVSAVQVAHHASGTDRLAPAAHAHASHSLPSDRHGRASIVRIPSSVRSAPARALGHRVRPKSEPRRGRPRPAAMAPAPVATSAPPPPPHASHSSSVSMPAPAAVTPTISPAPRRVHAAPALSTGSGSVRVEVGPVGGQPGSGQPGVAVSATVPGVSASPPPVDVPSVGAGVPAAGAVAVNLPVP
jgi:RNA polymerase sigma factor (sigma-70 family)